MSEKTGVKVKESTGYIVFKWINQRKCNWKSAGWRKYRSCVEEPFNC